MHLLESLEQLETENKTVIEEKEKTERNLLSDISIASKTAESQVGNCIIS